MTKADFMTSLREHLGRLPEAEVQERVDFYSEMIDDLMEEGLPEEEAVRRMGDPQQIAGQIIAETPLSTLVKEKFKAKRKIGGWVIALIVLGFPLWLPLLASAFAVLLAVYAVLWSLVISLWAVEVALWASVLGVMAGGAILLFTGRAMSAAAALGAALICAGLSIFLFFGCKAAAKGALLLGKCTLIAIKKSFARKETEA